MLAFSTVSWEGVNLFDIIPKLLVVENNQIIYVSVTQIEWPSKFPTATFYHVV